MPAHVHRKVFGLELLADRVHELLPEHLLDVAQTVHRRLRDVDGVEAADDQLGLGRCG